MTAVDGGTVAAGDIGPFVDDAIAPYASQWDRSGAIDDGIVGQLAERGWLAGVVPTEFGGAGLDASTLGQLCEEIGRACSSTRSLLTVQDMVAGTILRFGTDGQRRRWLPALASGRAVAGLCITEPEVGSDAGSVGARLEPVPGGWALAGTKSWVTFGARADVFLVLGRSEEGPTAVLVERAATAAVEPVRGQLGLRAAALATVRFDGALVEEDDIVGKPGSGFAMVAATALDRGRFTVAWGCVGIARACLEASLDYAGTRRQFDRPLVDHQLVRRMLSDMAVDVEAARLLCIDAAAARDARSSAAIAKTMAAKYFASRRLVDLASDAVQIHGANGVAGLHAVERHYRDAKVMQIIEGSDQMHQLALVDHARRTRRPVP